MKKVIRDFILYSILLISCKICFSKDSNIDNNEKLRVFVIDTLKTDFKKLPVYEDLFESQKSITFGRDQYQLGNYLFLIEDPENLLTIEQIISQENQNKFKHISEFPVLNKKHTYWGKLVIQNNLTKENDWAFYPGYTQFIELFISTNGNNFTIKKTGQYLNSNENDEILTLSDIIKILIPARKDSTNSITTIYIKYKCTDNYMFLINPILYNEPILEKQINLYKQNQNLIQGLLQGILWIMILYCLFTFLFTRERLYLLHALFTMTFSFLSLFVTEFMIDTVIENREINGIMPFILTPTLLIFFVLFIQKIIEIKRTHPHLNRILWIANILNCLLLIYTITTISFSDNYVIIVFLFLIINSITSLIVLTIILSLFRKLNTLSLFIVFGSSVYIICFFVFVFYVVYYDIVVHQITQLGQVIELLIFLLALGYRSRLIEKEKRESMAALVVQLEKNQELQTKVNRELEDKVKERTLEIEEQRDIVISQKNHIEKINTEITDSINYAKYIQSSILPKADQLESYLGEHFVLYKPKDIVSGDFYWISNIENKSIIAAVDCTGHGVPGAFMSMLGIALLNEIINKEYITHPGVILRRLRKEVINSLQQKGERGEQKDGMDIALCTLDLENMKLQFAGANNPLYLIRKSNMDKVGVIRCELIGDDQLYEIKGDPMPIGISDRMDNFTLHEIDVYKGDSFYLFTDGFPDQFGGPDGKKFGYKQFRELLLKNNSKTMPDQKISLEKLLNEWMGNNSQIDDILVIGFRIN